MHKGQTLKILVIEYITGGGNADQSFSPALQSEGEEMVTAVVRDFCDLPGVSVSYCRDRNLPPLQWGHPAWVEATDHDTLWATWKQQSRRCDAVLPIAPETDGLLVSLAEMISQCGCRLFASTGPALALAGSKSATAACLNSHQIPTIPTYECGPTLPVLPALPARAHGWIIKPDDGAGAHGVHYAADITMINALLSRISGPRIGGPWINGPWIIQPYIDGPVASLCALYHTDHTPPTLLATNTITPHEGRFTDPVLRVGAMNDHKEDFYPLVRALGQAIPGLRGYIGIDLIQGDGQWYVMDVNPRMTLSYTQLRPVLGDNPAGLLLACFG